MAQWLPNSEQFRLTTTWADKKWDYSEQGKCVFDTGILKSFSYVLKHDWDIWSMGSKTHFFSLGNVYCLGSRMIYFQWHVNFLTETMDSDITVQNHFGCSRILTLPHASLIRSCPEHFYIGLTENEMWPRPYLPRLWVKACLKHQWFPKDLVLSLCFLLVFFSKLQAFEAKQ